MIGSAAAASPSSSSLTRGSTAKPTKPVIQIPPALEIGSCASIRRSFAATPIELAVSDACGRILGSSPRMTISGGLISLKKDGGTEDWKRGRLFSACSLLTYNPWTCAGCHHLWRSSLAPNLPLCHPWASPLRHPRAYPEDPRPSLPKLVIQIPPIRVHRLDQLDLPLPVPSLERFFALDRRADRSMLLIPD